MSKEFDRFDGFGDIRLTRMARFRVCALLKKKSWQKQRCDVEMLYVDDECNRDNELEEGREIRAGRSSQIAVTGYSTFNTDSGAFHISFLCMIATSK